MIPLPSDAVNYDIICSASLYNDLDLLDESFRNISSLNDNDPLMTVIDDLGGLESCFYENNTTEYDKCLSFDSEKNPYIGHPFFTSPCGEIDLQQDVELEIQKDVDRLDAISPLKIFGPPAIQETQKQWLISGASPSYIADHDHCYSIVTKPSDSEKSPSPSASSESPSEVSSSEEEVDVITVPTEPKEQLLLAASNDEASVRSTRGRKNRTRPRNVMSQITLSKSSKVPVQGIKVRGSRSSRQKAPGSNPSYSDDDFAKRKEHNHSERQRRRNQQDLLQNLRKLIPDLETVVKAPKVRVLDSARIYINSLKLKADANVIQINALKQKQIMLRKTLRTLRSDSLISTKNIKHSKFLRNKL